uniref:Putative serine proteinase inhibitor n=1 Tax=Phlebotomus kandelakii TaxID=1109342 RepID=A0A6B2EGI0_9DIPT
MKTMTPASCLRVAFLTLCTVHLHTCSEIPAAKVSPIEESLFNFTLNLHRAKSFDDSTENLVLSPLGFNLILGQIAAGASPVLRETISKFLGWQKANLTDIHEHHEQILKRYNTTEDDEETLEVRINSAFFHRDYFKIYEDFKKLLEQQYNSELIKLPENATEAENQEIVNNWVKNTTNGLIKDFPISGSTISMFANVVYFNAEWLEPFSNQLTRKGKFFPTPEKTFNATYLMGQQEILYMEHPELRFKMIRLPYNSSNYNISMYIVSPQKHNLKEVLAEMTFPKFLEHKSKMSTKIVNIKMPKLGMKSKIHLKDTLARFMENTGNSSTDAFALNKVSNDSRSVLSEVVQESTFNVHEKGTTFASISAGYINYDGSARNCRVDKPYLAILLDEATNLVLFWATIKQPIL